MYMYSYVTSICPKYYCTQSSCAKKNVEKFSFNELKIEKLYNWKSFTESSTKTFALMILTLDVA